MRQPDMPMLLAYRRGELSAQLALIRAQYLDEAEAIIAEARRKQADVLGGLGERLEVRR